MDGVNDERLSKYSEDQLLIDIHFIDSKNRVFSGIDTYILVLDRIPVFFLLGLIYKTTWCLSFRKGMAEYYIYGLNWVNWTFRVNGQYVNQKRLVDGLKRYTSFWAGMNSISLKTKRKFKEKCKKIKTIVNWEKDFLTNQINKPWFDIGQVLWGNNEFNCTVLDVEKF